MTYTYCMYTVLRHSWWWTVDLSETCRVLYQINLRNKSILLAFIIKIYHDAQSYKCQIVNVWFETWKLTLTATHNCLSRSLKQNLFIFLWSSWLKKHFHNCKCCQMLLVFFSQQFWWCLNFQVRHHKTCVYFPQRQNVSVIPLPPTA